jgi:hypothetical protein
LRAEALAVTLSMTPAALHRIAFGGEDDPTFLRIGSGLVIAAAFPLALGIAADIYVVFLKISDQAGIAIRGSPTRWSQPAAKDHAGIENTERCLDR